MLWPGPQVLPDWFGTLKLGMSEDEMRAALGSPGQPWEERGIRGLFWEMQMVIVKAVFPEGRANFIDITFTLGQRPQTQAKALRELSAGMPFAEVERVCGGPGFVRTRLLTAGVPAVPQYGFAGLPESVNETREWMIFDGDYDAGASLTIQVQNGRVLSIRHPWVEKR